MGGGGGGGVCSGSGVRISEKLEPFRNELPQR